MEQTMTLKPIWGFLTRFTLVHFVTYWIFGLLFFYSSRVSWALCTTRNRHFYASHHFNLGICWSTFSAHQRTNHGLGDIPLPQGFPSWKVGMDVALGIIHRARNPIPSRTNLWLNRRYRLYRVTPSVPFNWLTWSSAANAGSFIPILLLGTATRGEENINSTHRNLHCDACAYYTWNSILGSNRLITHPFENLRQDIKLHVWRELGTLAVPGELEIVDSLPKTRSGKIMRRVLKAQEPGMDIGDIPMLEDWQ